MNLRLNREQHKMFADFFKDVAVGWFTALFAVPAIIPKVPLLTLFTILVSMSSALGISVYLLREKNE